MPEYRVSVYVQYEDSVEIKADDVVEAELLARRVTELILRDKASVSVDAYNPEEIRND